jgi:membrane dipeptidase
LGIIIDLAHINENGFWDTAGLTDAPLVVSHAGVHALCPSTRNLTDAQIDAVGQSEGVIGIVFEPTNTRRDGKPTPDTPTPLTEIVRHIDYVVERIGIDHVAFGSDFDGAEMPDDLRDITGLPRLIQALQDWGYDSGAQEKIAYKNWFRVLRATWKQ